MGPATSSGTQTPWTRLLCHFGTFHTLTIRLVFALSHAKSNYSRTSTKCARKSNHSRTYAKTGGWGCLPQNAFSHNPFVFFCSVIYMVNYMNYYIVGAPTVSAMLLCFLLLLSLCEVRAPVPVISVLPALPLVWLW